MESHTTLSDTEFVLQFQQCSLPVEYFTHEAHLRLAYIQVRDHGLNKAIENVQDWLRAFVRHVGAEDKYHETVTITAVHMVDTFMRRCPSCDFKELISKFPQMKSEFRELIATHYSFDIFSSQEARTSFVRPDKEGFNSNQ